ncbi:MAG: cyclic GMP-AMP synthase DncV-like nucleotidyltransferase [Pseudomonadota bacterium]
MKLEDRLNEFLANTVNINQSRIDTLTDRVAAVTSFLKDSETFEDCFVEVVPQGSYAHKTIIKPSEKKPEFDADILFYVTEVEGWEPKDYIEQLYQLLRENGTYRDKAIKQTRCVTINYVGEFSLDVVPCIRRDGLLFWETEHVLNALTNQEEPTRPKEYTEWLLEQDKTLGNHQLVKVVRLAKYLRDIKQTFSVKSILLTTLLGMQVDDWDGLLPGSQFSDLPTSLKTLFNRLDKWLQDRPDMPIVKNPVLGNEDFNRHWDQDKYSNFRDRWHIYTTWINDAYDEEGRQESILKWRRVFGEEYAKGVETAKAASTATAALPIPAHCEKPRWPVQNLAPVNIKATVHRSKEGQAIENLSSDGRALEKNLWLRFEVRNNYTAGIKLYWQVVNNGEEAGRVNGGLRGNIFAGSFVQWESTSYRGKHWVECFAIDSKKNICIGRSGRFIVNIQ